MSGSTRPKRTRPTTKAQPIYAEPLPDNHPPTSQTGTRKRKKSDNNEDADEIGSDSVDDLLGTLLTDPKSKLTKIGLNVRQFHWIESADPLVNDRK